MHFFFIWTNRTKGGGRQFGNGQGTVFFGYFFLFCFLMYVYEGMEKRMTREEGLGMQREGFEGDFWLSLGLRMVEMG